MPIYTEFLGVALGIFNYLLKRYMWSVYTAGSDQPPGSGTRAASLLPFIQVSRLQTSRNEVS